MASFTGAVGTTGWFDVKDTDPGQPDNVRTTNWDSSPNFPQMGGSISIDGYTVTGGSGTYSSLDVSVGSSLSGGFTFTGSFNNAGAITLSSNTLNYSGLSLTNSGTITLDGHTDPTFSDAQLRIAGSVSIGGGGIGGKLILSAGVRGAVVSNQDGQTATLTNLAGHTIIGTGAIVDNGYSSGGALALVNNGTITANDAAGQLKLAVTGGITNTGSIEATGAGGLAIFGTGAGSTTFASTGSGTLSAKNGGTIFLRYATIMGNIGSVGAGYVEILNGPNGEAVTFDGSASAFASSATIKTDDIDANTHGGNLVLKGQIANAGTINIKTSLIADATGATLNGVGTVALSGGSITTMYAQTATLTNTGNTIAGYGTFQADGGSAALTFNNSGTVNANSSGNTLALNASSVSNTGTLKATGGGVLRIGTTVDNSGGTVSAGDGSRVELANGSSLSGGTLASVGTGYFAITGFPGDATVGKAGVTTTSTATFNIGGSSSETLHTAGTFVNNGSILLNENGSLTASGTLSGTGTISLQGGYAIDGAILDYGNVISGAGTINATVDLETGGVIRASVSGSILNLFGAVANNNVLEANAGTLRVSSAVGGIGHALITNSGKAVFLSSFNQDVTFSGPGTLELSQTYSGAITGFGSGDTIKLDNVAYAAGEHFALSSSSNGRQTFALQNSANTTLASLTFVGSDAASAFVFSNDGSNHVAITKLSDTTPPTFTAITETPSTGTLTNPNTVVLKLATSEAVNVTGTPTLVLNDGGTAIYNASQSTSTSLAFVYTIGAHDTAVSALKITSVGLAGGASIADLAGNAANLSLTGLTQTGPAISPVNHTPVITAPNVTLTHAQTTSGVAASSLFSVTDSDNDAIASYDFYDIGGGGGHLALNGVTQANGAILNYTAAQLSQLTYVPGSAADMLYIRASDGYAIGAFTSFTVTPGPNAAPTVTAPNRTLAHNQTSIAASTLVSATDADNDPIKSYDFYAVGNGGGHLALNGVTQVTSAILTYTAAQLSQLTYVAGFAADTLYVRASDGAAVGTFTPFTITPGPNRAPVVATASTTLARGQTSVAISSLVSGSDPDGDAITSYNFYDAAVGSGRLLLNGVVQAQNTVLTYTVAQLSQLTYTAGASASLTYVRASDGSLTGDFASFSVSPFVNHAPTVTAPNKTLTHGQTNVAISTLITASDSDGDTVASYDFYDVGAGGGHLSLNGVTQANGAILNYTAAQLSQLTYVPGSATDMLYVRASDGSAIGAFTSFTITPGPNTAPVVAAPNKTLTHGQTNIAASSLFTATDSDSDPILSYDFYDVGAGGGHLALNGVTQASGAILTYSTSQLSQLAYVPGSATDMLYVRASDGSAVGAFTSFTVTPGPNTAPVVTAQNKTLTHAQTIGGVAASGLITTTDSDNDPVLSYDFYDVGAGGGHLALNGVTQANGAILSFTAAQLSQLTYQPGSATDTLYVRASDGAAVGAFAAFNITPGPDNAPTVTAANKTQAHGTSVQASTLFSASDADNDPVKSYSFYDTGAGGGHFSLNGTNQPTGAIFDITAAQLGGLTYTAGTGAADTIFIRASDGAQQGAFTQFAVSPT